MRLAIAGYKRIESRVDRWNNSYQLTKPEMLAIFCFLQVVDFSTTYVGLTLLGAHEANPVGKVMIATFGLVGMLVAFKLFAVGWAAIGTYKGKSLKLANWLYAVAMLWNCAILGVHAIR
jgi:uncharacterized membrane protein